MPNGAGSIGYSHLASFQAYIILVICCPSSPSHTLDFVYFHSKQTEKNNSPTMRTSTVFLAVATWMSHSSMARPIDTSVVDGAVAQVDVPDAIQYIDCDPKDPYCSKCPYRACVAEVHG